MTTKYNIRQKVWYMDYSNPRKGRVISISIDEINGIWYKIDKKYNKPESEVSDTKEGLRDIIFK